MVSTFSRPPCAAGGILVNSMVGPVLTSRAWQPNSTIHQASGRTRAQLEVIRLPSLMERNPSTLVNRNTIAASRRAPRPRTDYKQGKGNKVDFAPLAKIAFVRAKTAIKESIRISQ